TDGGIVLRGDVEVAGLLEACTRAGILAEDLILRSGRKAGGEGGRNADANEGGVAIVPTLVEASGPGAGLFGDGIIAAKRIQADVRRRERNQTNANARRISRLREADDAVDLTRQGASNGCGEELGAERSGNTENPGKRN